MSREDIKIIPLGGVCEIGKNMMLYEYDNSILIVDCGISFPDEEHPGVDLIIPDWTYLRENASRIAGLVLTHGHEDHVGAMGYFLRDFPQVPVYGGALTLGIMGGRLREHPVDVKSLNIHQADPGQIVKIGPFEVEFIRVGHSIPDACGLAITTPLGTIIQSGDFKFDQVPVDGRPPQFHRFAHYGEQNVLALLSDTTNAGRSGMTGGEITVRPGLEQIFADAPGRLLVATFASNVHRVQQVLEVAHAHNRRVACTGRSMLTITKIATELGYLKPPTPLLDIEEIDKYADHELCILMTGTQGEPMAALSKIARNQNRFVELHQDDSIILSSTVIPGNESAIYKVINALSFQGAHVYRTPHHNVHVSGHGNAEDLKMLLNLSQPKFPIPYHGEARHAISYADICSELGYDRTKIPFLQVGDVLSVSPEKCEIVGTVPSGSVLVDGLTIGDVGPSVLRDRKHLSDDGVLVATVILDRKTGALLDGPDLVQRGFLHAPANEEFLRRLESEVTKKLEGARSEGGRGGRGSGKAEGKSDAQNASRLIREVLSDTIWGTLKRRPVILPVVMEV